MLDMQYRMHPEISRFPSSEFYARSLKDGTVDTRGNVLSQLQPPVSEHLVVNALTGDRPSVVFLDHAGLEAKKDRSRINVTDAAIVCAVIEDLLRQNEVMSSFLSCRSVCLTPYPGSARRRYWCHLPIRSADFAAELFAQRRPRSQRTVP
jgi:superfamily I DNA and/or RNA helicase